MAAIVTICGRKFDCVPGTSLLKELSAKPQPDAAGEINSGPRAHSSHSHETHRAKLLPALFSSPWRSSTVTRTVATMAAFATCFAIVASPAHWLKRPSPELLTSSSTNWTRISDWPNTSELAAHEIESKDPAKRVVAAEETNRVGEEREGTPIRASYRSEIPTEIESRDSSPHFQPRTRDLAVLSDAEEIQQRLATLGYFFGPPTAPWGERSRAALMAFRRISGLGSNGLWDEATEAALFSSKARKSTSFVGTWAEDENACLTVPAVIRREGARAGDTFCAFGTAKLIAGVWNITATCSDPRRRWTVNARLAVSGDRLTWTSPKGTQTYTRCTQDVIAQA